MAALTAIFVSPATCCRGGTYIYMCHFSGGDGGDINNVKFLCLALILAAFRGKFKC